MKKQNGITLIALVITIIVMLILAGVSLNVLVGENGVLTQAQEAKKAHETAEEKELVDMAIAAAQMNEDLKVDYETLKKNIQASFGDNAEVWEEENLTTGCVDYKIKLPNGNVYSTESNIIVYCDNCSKPIKECECEYCEDCGNLIDDCDCDYEDYCEYCGNSPCTCPKCGYCGNVCYECGCDNSQC